MSGNQGDPNDEGSLESLVERAKAGHPAVLAALLMRIKADDAIALATLVERAKTRDSATLSVLVKRAREKDTAALAALTEHAKTNARGAFDKLIERYSLHIEGYIRSLVRDKSVVEDLVQETFIKAWLGLPGLNDAHRFLSWFREIAKNVVIDNGRKLPKVSAVALEQMKHWIDAGGEAADPHTFVAANEYRKEVIRRVFKDFLQQGKRKHLECFRLHTFTNLPDEDIGKIVGIDVKSVGVYCSQVRAALRKELHLEQELNNDGKGR